MGRTTFCHICGDVKSDEIQHTEWNCLESLRDKLHLFEQGVAAALNDIEERIANNHNELLERIEKLEGE